MKSFKLPAVSTEYNPLNNLWWAQMKNGMTNFLEYDENKDKAILKVQTEYIIAYSR